MRKVITAITAVAAILALASVASAKTHWTACPQVLKQNDYAVNLAHVGCPFGKAAQKVIEKGPIGRQSGSFSITVRFRGRSYGLRCSLSHVGLIATCQHNHQDWVRDYFDSAQGW